MTKNRKRLSFLIGALAGFSLAGPQALRAANINWDANGATAAQTDGAGAWLGTNQWWNGTANVDWTSGDDAFFGVSGAGGAVTLASSTTVNSLTANPFTGTYTLGTSGAGSTITLNNGITSNSGNGTVTIISPLILGAAQTWTNNSGLNISGTAAAGSLIVGGTTDGINNNGFTLTFAGVGTSELKGAISGSGGLIKNGPGVLILRQAPTMSYTGATVINGGVVRIAGADSFGTGTSVTINDGVIEGYFSGTFNRALGTGANQIQILGGTSGFSGQGATSTTFQIGTAGSTLTWGSAFFNPAVFVLGASTGNTTGKMTLANAIDLNGATRTIASFTTTDGAAASGATISGAITNGGLIKTGQGNLILTNAGNTYSGSTTINGGFITLSGSGAINSTSALTLGGSGTIRLVNTAQVNRFADSAAITANGGGIIYENTSGANVYTETVGSLTLNSGQFNIVLTNDQVGAGSQTLTIGTGGLVRSGSSNTSTIAFSAGGAGLSATKNIVAVTGAAATPTDQIIGPWATTGTAAATQTDYAVYDASGFVLPANMGTTSETGWTTAANSYALNTGATETLTATRTIASLRFYGAASDLALSTFKLETNGLLFGGANAKTVSAGTGGAVTTPSGGGNLYITAGQASPVHILNAPVTDNSGTVNLVKSGSGTIVLNGLNTYTGDTSINAGTLRIGTNGTANGANLNGGSYAGKIFLGNGATLNVQTNVNQTLSGVISGEGNLFKAYTGVLTLTGANTFTGKTSITPLTTAGAGTLVISSLNSVVGGTASSSLGAPTTVANGTIDLGASGIQAGATLQYVGSGETTDRVINFQFNGNASKTIDASGSGLLRFTSAPTANTTTSNSIILTGSGDGQFDGGLPFVFTNFTKSGAGSWTLGGPVGSTGTFTLSTSGSTLIATDPRALGANLSGVSMAGSTTLSLRNNSSVTYGVANTGYNISNSASAATIDVRRVSGTGSNTITVGNLPTSSTAGAWQLNFTGADGVSLNAGVLTAPTTTGTTVATHTINNNIASTNGAALTLASVADASTTTAAKTLVFTGSGNTNVTGAVTAANHSLSKTGSGKLTLNGTAAYSGTTTISAGTLSVGSTGDINSSAVTINGATANLAYNSATNYTNTLTFTQGTLSGTNWNGNLSGLTVDTNKTISPGNSPGTATSVVQTWAGGGTYQWEINNASGTVGADPGWDLLSLTGALTQTANSGSKFTIDITGLNTSNVAGSVSNWTPGSSSTYVIASAAGGITGFDASGYTLNVANFSNNNSSPGTWSIFQGNGTNGGTVNDIVLGYTASGGSANFVFTNTSPVALNLLRNGTGIISTKTIQNSGSATGNASLANTNSNLSVSGILNNIAAAATEPQTLSATSTSANGTSTGTLTVTLNSGGSNVVNTTVTIGNASFDGTNSSTIFGAPLSTLVAAAANLPSANFESNSINATVTGGGPIKVGTTASILRYDNSSGGAETVSMAWRSRTAAEANLAVNPKALLSDVVRVTGMGAPSTDVGTFVLTMTYDLDQLQFAGLNENSIALSGELKLAWYNGTEWVNAIAGNIGGATPTSPTLRAPLATDPLGTWGIDTSGAGGTGYVWAVLNHNSDFAVIPEPSTLVFGGLALLGFAGAGLRKRRMAKHQA